MKKIILKQIFLCISILGITNSLKAQSNDIPLIDKLYGISEFWQEVNYNFVYLDKVDKTKWDSLYKATLVKAMEVKDDYEYYRLLDKLCAFLKDGHTNIYYPEALSKEVMITNFGEYRIFISNIDGKAIITRVNESKKTEIPIGSEITKVNGVATQSYMDEFVKPFISASTDYVLQNQATYELLKGYKGSKFEIEFKKPNGTFKVLQLEHQLTAEKEVYPKFKQRALLDYKQLDNDIHYLALNSFQNNQIDTLFKSVLPNLYRAKSIIIDLRYNGGGNTTIGFNILQYFTKDTLLYGAKSITRNHIPTYKAWGTFLTPKDTLNSKPEWGMTKEEITKSFLVARDLFYYEFPYEPTHTNTKEARINVPVAVLMGNATASAAEDFLIYADPLNNFTFIGDKSYGSTGQPYLFDLPYGGRARICTKKDLYPNGKEFVGIGIIPDIFVPYTLQDYLTDNDPVLNKAIAYLKTKNSQ